ncbi:hypothetical protein HPB47_019735 [Ixodes persulcatus]|uniref:Uncharacterized protein n=1 Tax=Ixodes persulcatus TaxID=34615 RepID=A0AC60QKW1_IXOPE|nr:hypothetical protein HPB47_019735 [Ixodes persulcatus]
MLVAAASQLSKSKVEWYTLKRKRRKKVATAPPACVHLSRLPIAVHSSPQHHRLLHCHLDICKSSTGAVSTTSDMGKLSAVPHNHGSWSGYDVNGLRSDAPFFQRTKPRRLPPARQWARELGHDRHG